MKLRICRSREPARAVPSTGAPVDSSPPIEIWRRPDRLRVAAPIAAKTDAPNPRGFSRDEFIADTDAVGRFR